MAAGVSAALAMGCAGSQASESSTAPAAGERAASDSRVERERPASMGRTRVYGHDELDETGEADLGRALHRAGHSPR